MNFSFFFHLLQSILVYFCKTPQFERATFPRAHQPHRAGSHTPGSTCLEKSADVLREQRTGSELLDCPPLLWSWVLGESFKALY